MGKQSKSRATGKGGGARAGAAGPGGVRHVSPAEIGAYSAEEERAFLDRGIHLFGPSMLDRAVFCRQLATMIEVGIPLLRGLKILAKRTPHPRLAGAVDEVARRVEEGQPVSQSMAQNESMFTPLVCQIVKVGEVGGILEDSLVRLAEIMESKAETRRKVRAAMMYPAVALLVAIGVLVVILVKAVPVFTGVYGQVDQELPGATRFVIGLSNLVTEWLWLWALILVGLVVWWQWFVRTPAGQGFTSVLALRLPVIGRIATKIGVARFTRTISGLLTAGIPLVESISIAADTNENTVVSNALRDVYRSVEQGEKVAGPLARARIFPPLVVDMVAIGEETGTLDRMLKRVADIYDADVDSTLRGLSSIIEPVLIVFMGVIVIFIALAVLLPYFNLVQVV